MTSRAYYINLKIGKASDLLNLFILKIQFNIKKINHFYVWNFILIIFIILRSNAKNYFVVIIWSFAMKYLIFIIIIQ